MHGMILSSFYLHSLFSKSKKIKYKYERTKKMRKKGKTFELASYKLLKLVKSNQKFTLNDAKSMQRLIASGAKVNFSDSKSLATLDYAKSNRNQELIHFLTARGAKLAHDRKSDSDCSGDSSAVHVVHMYYSSDDEKYTPHCKNTPICQLGRTA